MAQEGLGLRLAIPQTIVKSPAHSLTSAPGIPVGSVIGANMGFKLLVAQRLEVAQHFIERVAFRVTGRFEPPSTFGATKTPKTRQFNPYQLPAHGCLYRFASEYQRAVIRIRGSLHTPILMGLSGILHIQIFLLRYTPQGETPLQWRTPQP